MEMAQRWGRIGAGCVEAGWLACVVAVPLLVAPALSLSYTADKVLSFRVLTEALGLIGFLLWLQRPRLRPAPLTLAVAAVAGLMLLSTLFGRNFSDGFWGSYLRLFGFFTRMHGWVLFLVVAAYFRTEGQWRRLLRAMALVSLILCAHALIQWRGRLLRAMALVSLILCAHALIQWRGLEGRLLFSLLGPAAAHWHTPADAQYRPFSTLGNSSFLGTYLVFGIAFALGSLTALPRRQRWAGLLMLGLLTFVLIINQTRGAWLAAAAMAVAYALLIAPAARRRRIALACGAIAAAVLLFGAACAHGSQDRWVTSHPICVRLAHFFQRDRNSSGWYRLDMWRRVGSQVSTSPASLLLGYGPESYLLVASRSFEPAYADGSAPAQFMDSTHNIFADALVEGGLLGLGALLAVLFLGFRTGLRGLRQAADPAQRAVLITAVVSLVGYAVQGIFLFDHITTLVYLCVTLGLIGAASSPDWGVPWAGLNAAPDRPLPAPLGRALAGAAVAAVCVGLLPFNVRAIRAQIWKRTAEELSAADRMEEATAAMRQACRLMPGERTYHVMLAASLVSAEAQRTGDQDELLATFREAEKELRRAIALDPGDVRTYWPLGQLYQYWGAYDREKFRMGEETYRLAAALSPRRQWTYWEWGNLEFLAGKRAAALERYQYALALDPTVTASQRALAQLYVRLGQPERAEPLYVAAWRRMAAESAAALTAAERAGEHEMLGLAFLAKGRSDKARFYLGGALRLDPQRTRAREALNRLAMLRISAG